jgi:hypothetical protein
MPPMSARSSAETFGRPTRLRDRERQYARPIRPKAGTAPAHYRLRSNKRDRAKHREQNTIVIGQVRSLRHSPAKNIDLPSKDQDFGLEVCSRFEK